MRNTLTILSTYKALQEANQNPPKDSDLLPGWEQNRDVLIKQLYQTLCGKADAAWMANAFVLVERHDDRVHTIRVSSTNKVLFESLMGMDLKQGVLWGAKVVFGGGPSGVIEFRGSVKAPDGVAFLILVDWLTQSDLQSFTNDL